MDLSERQRELVVQRQLNQTVARQLHHHLQLRNADEFKHHNVVGYALFNQNKQIFTGLPIQ